jgi:hypothetical protein
MKNDWQAKKVALAVTAIVVLVSAGTAFGARSRHMGGCLPSAESTECHDPSTPCRFLAKDS